MKIPCAVGLVAGSNCTGRFGSSEKGFLVTADWRGDERKERTKGTRRRIDMVCLYARRWRRTVGALKKGLDKFPPVLNSLLHHQNVFRWQTQRKQGQEGRPVHPHGRWFVHLSPSLASFPLHLSQVPLEPVVQLL